MTERSYEHENPLHVFGEWEWKNRSNLPNPLHKTRKNLARTLLLTDKLLVKMEESRMLMEAMAFTTGEFLEDACIRAMSGYVQQTMNFLDAKYTNWKRVSLVNCQEGLLALYDKPVCGAGEAPPEGCVIKMPAETCVLTEAQMEGIRAQQEKLQGLMSLEEHKSGTMEKALEKLGDLMELEKQERDKARQEIDEFLKSDETTKGEVPK